MVGKPEVDTHVLSLERVAQEGLETLKFSCSQCEFRGEYVLNRSTDVQHLDIFARGDPEVFHFNNELFMLLLADSFSLEEQAIEVLDWGEWLSPKMRSLLEQM